MSRIGNLPIEVPDGVTVDVSGKVITVKGSKGTMTRDVPRAMEVEVKDGQVTVKAKSNAKAVKSMHGTLRMLIFNMIHGVSEGWSKQLELVGTGYRVELSGDSLLLTVGFSHSVTIKPPEGISFEVQKTEITVDGVDKELVGLTAANIRRVRPPEPYKGKGIRYKGEEVRRKPGKAAKAAGAV